MKDNSSNPMVVVGLERLETDFQHLVSGRKTGLLAHPASVTGNFEHAFHVLGRAGADLVQLFGPEHGFAGAAQDMEAVDDQSESASVGGVALHSLYGSTEATLAPPLELLRDLDVLVVDLADVGARYYTYVWTAALCLKACWEAGVSLVIADRPNPLGGDSIEGPMQQEGYLSFVGLYPVPVRHGMTPAEILQLVAAREGWSDALTVVPMEGWQRSMLHEDTRRPWVLPSPNMPTPQTVLVYPGACLIEGTEASEGRGTTRPFEFVGAPGIDGHALKQELDAMGLQGVAFRPISFKPGFQKHKDQHCGGVQLHVDNPRNFRPYRTGVALLLAMRHVAPDHLIWRQDPYEFVSQIPAIDLLTGSSWVRQGVDGGMSLDEVCAGWDSEESAFAQLRRAHLLYE